MTKKITITHTDDRTRTVTAPNDEAALRIENLAFKYRSVASVDVTNTDTTPRRNRH